MMDVEEIIDFIRQLKRGFDKELFQSKIDELAYIAETSGLDSEDFYNLFKIWLNLSIPITKWMSLGACLVPQDQVEERSVDYAFRWLLANCENHANFSRMAFLLDWLTAAMDSDAIDMTALDSGYEIFYTLLSFDVLTPHALKLVYTMTKPSDVTRLRVVELLELAKKREGKKNMYRQIEVLLGLFKSYKPECVPENVPAISVHTSFKKINIKLLARFKKRQEQRNRTTKERHHLMWTNPLSSDSGKNRKADPLVPNMEFSMIGSKQYSEMGHEAQKTHLDFSDPVSLIQHSVLAGGGAGLRRPARLRALLCNQAGLALLALASSQDLAFLAHDLHHLLTTCFLASSPHSYAEKADLLHRLAALQNTLLQGIPVVTRFLMQFLPFWNEKDYFAEILTLLEWVSVENAEQASLIVEPLTKIYYRAEPLEQCAILRTLTTMHGNLVYSSTRSGVQFGWSRAHCDHAQVLSAVATAIADMCQKGLQINPEDMRVLFWSLRSAEACPRAQWAPGAGAGAGAGVGTGAGAGAGTDAGAGVDAGALALAALPRTLTLALPLLLPTALPLDKIAAIIMLYRTIISHMKSTRNKETYIVQRKTLQSYTLDFLSCLYHEQALTQRKSGLVFTQLHPQLVSKLTHMIPEIDSAFSIRNNLTFFILSEDKDTSESTNKLYFDSIVSQSFPNLSDFLVQAVPELNKL